MAKVYISSTYEDLKEQRKLAAEAVRKQGHTPIIMEDYGISPQKPLDKCLQDVSQCDLFIGIFAWRYGTIPKGHEKSITHQEYEEAIKNNIPCLIFLLHESAPWPANLMAKGPERKTIDDLRLHLGENHLICFFKSKRQLSQKVKQAIKKELPPPKSNLLKRLAATLLIPIAIVLYLKFAPPDPPKDIKPEPTDSEAVTVDPTPKKKENPKSIKKPDYVVEAEKKGAKTQKNIKGYWEADFGDGIVLIYIPAGEFTMGSDDERDREKPLHKVYLDGYWIGKTEVTVGQYMKFVNETKTHYPVWLEPGSDDNIETGSDDWYKRLGGALTGEHYPIVGVSWHDAVAYCDWLSRKNGITITLPTEAQWEKAARGTDGRKYPWGNGKLTGILVNSSLEDGYNYTSPAGSFPAGSSPFGAMDMAGNVWEWCQDWFDSDYYKNSPKNNLKGPKSGDDRVMRGGGWVNDSGLCRCAYRNCVGPSLRGYDVGFRLVRSL